MWNNSQVVIDIGSGLGIDESSGEMVVLDSGRVAEELAGSTDACDRAVAALVAGAPDRADIELQSAPPTFRRDMLRGEVARAAGRPPEAITILNDVLNMHQPQGLRLATLMQHLGKAECAGGHHQDAVRHLEQALTLRVQMHAPTDQIASSQSMLNIARRSTT